MAVLAIKKIDEERQKSHIGETPVHGSFGDPGRWG